MNIEEVLVPDTGNDGEMDVIEVAVSIGDVIEKEQTLIVLESDKATMEIPSSVAGKLVSLKLKSGDRAKSGDVIAEVEVTASEATNEVQQEKAKTETPVIEPIKTAQPENAAKQPPVLEQKNETIEHSQAPELNTAVVHAGPAVRKFAREHAVDLSRVRASGPRARILQEDVTQYIKSQIQRAQNGQIIGAGFSHGAVALPDFKQFGEISAQTMTKVHLKTAENMQRSCQIPQVTQFDEADITALEEFRKKQKNVAEQKGIKLTPMAFLLKACAYALKALPQFNVSLDLANQHIIQKHYVHIAFAVDTPYGLFVPVIRDVDKKGIWEIAGECQDLAARARDKKLLPAEMQGACFTISSLGAIGGTSFTPIVNSPEVAILGVSKAQIKPVYNAQGEWQPKLMLPLSLTYDHRAVNGADGARFTSLLGNVLSDLRELLL